MLMSQCSRMGRWRSRVSSLQETTLRRLPPLLSFRLLVLAIDWLRGWISLPAGSKPTLVTKKSSDIFHIRVKGTKTVAMATHVQKSVSRSRVEQEGAVLLK
jgi:hypothetical protein